MRHRLPRSILLFWLLALLLATQLLAAAHETTHGLGADSDRCAVCLRADQFRASAPAAAPPPVPAPAAELPAAAIRRAAPAAVEGIRYPRGPPTAPIAC